MKNNIVLIEGLFTFFVEIRVMIILTNIVITLTNFMIIIGAVSYRCTFPNCSVSLAPQKYNVDDNDA